METDEQIHRRRNWVATVVTLSVLLLICIFLWRVFYFTQLINKGEIDPASFEFGGAFSTQTSLASIPVPDGEFDVVTSDDPSLGTPGAPMTIVEFADFGCPYSREVSFVLRKFIQAHPEDIHYVYRDFPILELHPLAQTVAEASECAQEQNAFWPFHDKLYQNQNDLSEERLFQFAREVGMNESRFRNCVNSGKYTEEVLEDFEVGLEAGVRGTPTFFVNGNRISGSIPEDVFEQLLTSITTQ